MNLNDMYSALERLKYDESQNVVKDKNGEIVNIHNCRKIKDNIRASSKNCEKCPLSETIKIVIEQNKRLTEANSKLTEKLLEKI